MSYQRPGVYINTSLTPLTPGASAPGQSTAAFVGVHTQGPTVPTLVTSWNQFQKLYGGFGNSRNYLPFAVWQYFANNGNQCYVVRAAASDAVASTLTVNDRELGAGAILPPINVAATAAGSTGVTPTDYGYIVTAVNANGETNGGIEAVVTGNATLDPTNSNVVTWTAVTGATGYRIYRRTLPEGYGDGSYGAGGYGGALNDPLFLSSVSGQATATFTDDGTHTPMGDLPEFNTTGAPVPIIKFTASAVGTWGNSIYVDIVDSTNGEGRVSIIIRAGGTEDSNIVERFVDVSMDPTDNRYLISMLNSTQLGSQYVKVKNLGTWTTWDTSKTPQTASLVPLTGGLDGSGTPNLVTAVQSLSTIKSNLDLNLPGVYETTTMNNVLNWTNTQPNIFVVIDTPPATIGADGATPSESATVDSYLFMVQGSNQISDTPAAAIFAPWLQVSDPISTIPGATRTLPPGGAVLGRFSQTDATSGVQKSPAGVDIPLQRVVGVELPFQDANLDTLNTNQINVIRNIPGYGYCIMGSRTLLQNMPNRYIAIQRTLMNVQQSLKENTIFAVFEDNNATLWSRISAVVSQYLMGIWQQGMLTGGTAEEAFFVQCDEENNTPTTIAAGEVHIQVGLALNNPAEFVVIDINQMSSSTTTTTV